MTVGEKRRCWIPPNLAYRGERGLPTGLLIFDIELLDFQPSPTIPPSNLVEPPVDAEKLTSGLIFANPFEGFFSLGLDLASYFFLAHSLLLEERLLKTL